MRRWRLLITAVVCSLSLSGQTSPPAPEQPPVIRSDTQEVVLDVVVRDKKGRLIRNVRPEQIHLAEDGKPVPTRNFRLVSRSLHSQSGSSAAPVGAPEARARFERHIALVFDDLGTLDTQIAKRSALQVVKSMTDPDLYLCLLETGVRSRLITPFSNDRAELTKAIEAYTAQVRSRGPMTRDFMDENIQQAGVNYDKAMEASKQQLQQDLQMGGPMAAAMIRKEKQLETQINQVQSTTIAGDLYSQFRAEDFERTLNARPTLAALQAILNWEREIPGRKAVLLFTHGLFVTDALRDSFRQLINTANKAGITFYVLDISGVTLQDRMEGDPADRLLLSNIGAPASQMGQGFIVSGRTADLIRDQSYSMLANGTSLTSDSLAALSEFTGSTGGFLVSNTNDFRKPTQRLLDDLSTYYELTYARSNTVLDGRYHPLSVTVDRPNAIVQTRSGYFALPNESGQVVQPWEAPLLNALNSPAPHPSDVPARIAAFCFHTTGDRVAGAAIVEVPFTALQVQEDEQAKLYTAHLSWVALLRAKDGSVAAKLSRDAMVHGLLDSLDNARRVPLDTEDSFSVAPGVYTLDIQLQDRISTHMGWTSIPVTIKSPPPGPQLSDVVDARRIEPGSSDSPWLRTRGAGIVPSLDETIPADQKKLNLFMILFPDAASGTPAFHIQLSQGARVLEDKPLILPAPEKDGGIRVILSIPLTSLDPGSYDIGAFLMQGARSVSQSFHFVRSGTSPLARAATPASDSAASVAERTWKPEIVAGPKPDVKEQQQFLARVEERAEDYQQRLPDFICTQVTDRFIASHSHEWKLQDRLRHRLQYVSGSEAYIAVDSSGNSSKDSVATGLVSSGELGSLLHMILQGKPAWKWEGATLLDGERMQIYSFQVPLSRSSFQLSYEPRNLVRKAGFSGLLYAQAETADVRLIAVTAENLPKDFPIQESQVEVRYDYVRLAGRDRLLPAKAVVRTRTGHRSLTKNEISFLDYRVFDANSKIRYEFR